MNKLWYLFLTSFLAISFIWVASAYKTYGGDLSNVHVDFKSSLEIFTRLSNVDTKIIDYLNQLRDIISSANDKINSIDVSNYYMNFTWEQLGLTFQIIGVGIWYFFVMIFRFISMGASYLFAFTWFIFNPVFI